MDEDLVRCLRSEAILTQRLCDVCAVNCGSAARFAATLPGFPRVVSLESSSLADILRDIPTMGEVLGVPQRAEAVVGSLIDRIEAVRERAAGAPRRCCVPLEWIDPPLSPATGDRSPWRSPAADSVAVRWEAVVEVAPEVLARPGLLRVRPSRTFRSCGRIPTSRGPAAQCSEVYVVDGSAYFSHPGPRIADSFEILAEILHPERFDGRFSDPRRRTRRVTGPARAARQETRTPHGPDDQGPLLVHIEQGRRRVRGIPTTLPAR